MRLQLRMMKIVYATALPSRKAELSRGALRRARIFKTTSQMHDAPAFHWSVRERRSALS